MHGYALQLLLLGRSLLDIGKFSTFICVFAMLLFALRVVLRERKR